MLQVYKGSFQARSTTGSQTVNGIVDQDGNSFTPEALILFGVGVTALATFADGMVMSFGATDGATGRASSAQAVDNVATQTSSRRAGTGPIDWYVGNAAATMAASLTSFGSGQFVLNWGTVTGNQEYIEFIAIGGTEFAAFGADFRLDNGATRAAQTPTFDPDCLINFLTTTTVTTALSGFGWFVDNGDGSFTQGVSGWATRHNVSPSDAYKAQRTDGYKMQMSTTTAAITNLFARDVYGEVPIVGPTGSTITDYGLMLGGVSAKCGTLTQPGATGNQAITGVGFKPKVVIFLTHGAAANTAVQTGEAFLSIGAADRSRQGVAASGNIDNSNPSVAAQYQDHSNVVATFTAAATAASSAFTGKASLVSMDDDGFTINWSVIGAGAQVLWFALGDETSQPSEGNGGTWFG